MGSTLDIRSRKRPGRPSDKGVINLAGDVLRDIVVLLHAELRLLRAEISEKLRLTALSAALIGAGALLLAATIVLLLQAAIAALVAYGIAWPLAILIVATAALLLGVGLIWFGVNNFRLNRLAPSRTLNQLEKDTTVVKHEANE
jgi:Putative Actinobacterial Holin-X, holin superfamily III